MPESSPEASSPNFQQVHELFARASSLPAGEREAFVRAEAKDPKAVAEVLALLAAGDMRTSAFAGAARQELHEATAAESGAGERVQSTATGELLAKLATAPKLDAQRYALDGEIGKGGMGAVLRIHDQYLNRRLAMKVMLERPTPRDDEERKLVHQLLGRFLEEAQVTSQLDHPGVVPVHELGLDASGKAYFTMRLVKGRTANEVFADALAEQNDWTLTRALEVILKVCDTMAYAHDKGVLHRDLKPRNVMVGRFGEVYVMDWGLAKVLGHADRHDLRIRRDPATGVSRLDTARKRDAENDDSASVASMDGQQLGTPSYMSPEQARSEDLDRRADVYSIGAMLYELVAGRAPYVVPGVRKLPYRILDEVAEGPPKRIESIAKGVPAELVAIADRAMARDRNERYASVLELGADLRAFLAQRVVTAYRTGALVEMRLWMRRNRALAASLAVCSLLFVVAGALVSVAAYQASQASLASLREASRARKAESEALFRAAELAAERGRWDVVLDSLARAEQLGYADAVAIGIRRIYAYVGQIRFDEAQRTVRALNDGKDLGDRRPRVQLLYGIFGFDRTEDPDAGRVEIEACLRSGKLDAFATEIAGACLAETLSGAIAHATEALRLEPEDYLARLLHLALSTGRTNVADNRTAVAAFRARYPDDQLGIVYATEVASPDDGQRLFAELRDRAGSGIDADTLKCAESLVAFGAAKERLATDLHVLVTGAPGSKTPRVEALMQLDAFAKRSLRWAPPSMNRSLRALPNVDWLSVEPRRIAELGEHARVQGIGMLHFCHALVLRNVGRLEEAEEAATRACADRSMFAFPSVAHALLVDVQLRRWRMGKTDDERNAIRQRAIECIGRALAAAPDAEGLRVLVRAAAELGDLRLAQAAQLALLPLADTSQEQLIEGELGRLRVLATSATPQKNEADLLAEQRTRSTLNALGVRVGEPPK